jgi:hypothetical protein
MGFLERLFGRKKEPDIDPAHSPYILPGEMGYAPAPEVPEPAPEAPEPAPVATTLRPPPPPPPPVFEPAPVASVATPPVAEPEPEPEPEPAPAQEPEPEPEPELEAPAPAVAEDRPKAVAHEPLSPHDEAALVDFDIDPGKPGAAWVILEDGTVAYLPGDPDLKDRMRYLADNLLPPSEKSEKSEKIDEPPAEDQS